MNSNTIEKTEVARVFNYWFGNEGKNRWFESNPERRDMLDKEIEQMFGDLLMKIETLNEEILKEDMDTRICAIIVLDQFSR
jgi:uncharacterized protein (DUF924 family)